MGALSSPAASPVKIETSRLRDMCACRECGEPHLIEIAPSPRRADAASVHFTAGEAEFMTLVTEVMSRQLGWEHTQGFNFPMAPRREET